jgi:hypothetical protein
MGRERIQREEGKIRACWDCQAIGQAVAVLYIVSGLGNVWATQSNEPNTTEQRASHERAARDLIHKPTIAVGGKSGMIKIPVSSKIRGAEWPRPGVPEYTFNVRSYGGPLLGTDVREFDWILQVDSRRSLISVESFRSDADIPGQPIGVFRTNVDDHQLREFHKLLTDARLSELRPAMKGHPGSTERLYVLEQPSQEAMRVLINNSDEQTNALIAPLRNKLNSMLATSFTHPERAAQLGISYSQAAGGGIFEVSITNIGVEEICFVDPRWLIPEGPFRHAALMVSEFPETPPGESPALAWTSLPLQPIDPRPENEPLITLDPGKAWKASSLPWKRVLGKRYLVFFTWANYAGEAKVDGLYRIRGRAHSPRLVIEP